MYPSSIAIISLSFSCSSSFTFPPIQKYLFPWGLTLSSNTFSYFLSPSLVILVPLTSPFGIFTFNMQSFNIFNLSLISFTIFDACLETWL